MKEFVIKGTKEELREVEKILKAAGIESDEEWNKRYRDKVSCIYLWYYPKDNDYGYYSHAGKCKTLTFKQFLNQKDKLIK